jgi:hypothetical protein
LYRDGNYDFFYQKKLKTGLTAGSPVLTIPSLYTNSLRIIEIGRPLFSTVESSAGMKVEILCGTY